MIPFHFSKNPIFHSVRFVFERVFATTYALHREPFKAAKAHLILASLRYDIVSVPGGTVNNWFGRECTDVPYSPDVLRFCSLDAVLFDDAHFVGYEPNFSIYRFHNSSKIRLLATGNVNHHSKKIQPCRNLYKIVANAIPTHARIDFNQSKEALINSQR